MLRDCDEHPRLIVFTAIAFQTSGPSDRFSIVKLKSPAILTLWFHRI